MALLDRIAKALAQGLINKREAALIKKSTGRISNNNTPAQNLAIAKLTKTQSIKQTSTVGGYIGERQKVSRLREQGVDEKTVRRELLKDIQPVFDAANKRIKRLNDIETAGISLPSLRDLRSDLPTGNFSVKGKDVDELIKDYKTAIRFMNHETSTQKGASKHIQQSIKTFGGTAKQATQRRRLVDDLMNDKIDISSPNYADFTMWISHNVKTIDQFNESEVRKKVDEIEAKKRKLREQARKKAAEQAGKPQVSSTLLRELLK